MPVTRDTSAQFSRQLVLVAAMAALVLMASVPASSLTEAWAQAGPFGSIRPPAASGFTGWLLAKQALFCRAMAGLIRAARTNGSAYWGLMGISFVYGIFHAAGPGHGKAVISSYLLANEETWRRGIVLSFASAMLQALTAVVIHRCAQFPGLCLLLTRDRKCALEIHRVRLRRLKRDFPCNSIDLSLGPPFAWLFLLPSSHRRWRGAAHVAIDNCIFARQTNERALVWVRWLNLSQRRVQG